MATRNNDIAVAAKKTPVKKGPKDVSFPYQIRFTVPEELRSDAAHYASLLSSGNENELGLQFFVEGIKRLKAGEMPNIVHAPSMPEGEQDLIWLEAAGANNVILNMLYASHRTSKKTSFNTLREYLRANIAKGTTRYNRDSANQNCAIRIRELRRQFEEQNLAGEVDRVAVLRRLAEEAVNAFP